MSKSQRPPGRIIAAVVSVIALTELALWIYLEPTPTTSQEADLPIAGNHLTATYQAVALSAGTPDALVDTSTPTSTWQIVIDTLPPENNATATADALHATAVAYVTSVNSAVTGTVSPTPGPVTETPQPTKNDVSQAVGPSPSAVLAEAATATYQPTAIPPPTSLPTSTPTTLPTPIPPSTPTAVPTASPTSVSTPEFAPVPETTAVDTIRFELGATSATVASYVDYEQPVRYMLAARANQPMTVVLQNQGDYLARVDISTEEGIVIGSALAGETWSDMLPATQNYYLTIRVPVEGTGHDFSLWVEILP